MMLLYCTPTKPQDFVYGLAATATTHLLNNKWFPPTLTCEMLCVLLIVGGKVKQTNKLFNNKKTK